MKQSVPVNSINSQKISDSLLSVTNLNAYWHKTQILKNVNLSVQPGDFLCISGPNGSGKSTLLNCMSGISVPNLHVSVPKKQLSSINIQQFQPSIQLNGKPINSYKRKDSAKYIAYLTQSEYPAWSVSCYQTILSGRYCHTNSTGFYTKQDYMVTDSLISMLHLEQLSDKSIISLSGGEFQKVRIARCLAQEPDFLLLDEPVANLDFSYQTELLTLLKHLSHEGYTFSQTNPQKKPSILLSIHDLNLAARFADQLILLSKISGTSNSQALLKGTPDQILTVENLQTIYNQTFGIFTHPQFNCPQIYQ